MQKPAVSCGLVWKRVGANNRNIIGEIGVHLGHVGYEAGIWKLKVEDVYNGDDGVLQSWSLTIMKKPANTKAILR